MIKTMYPILIFISFLLPRNKNIFVFGNQKGYIDNTRFFFEFVSNNKKYRICPIWLANNVKEYKEVKDKGYKSVLKNSILGYYYSSRASFSFICNGYSDVNRILSLKGKVINFWHGTPIKKIFFDTQYSTNKFGDNVLFNKLSKILLRMLINNIDFYYASNNFEREVVTKAAGIDMSKSIALGAPRFDYIRGYASENKLIKIKEKNKRVILYAPTWRENSNWPGFSLSKGDYDYLDKMLSDTSSILVVNPHPLTDPSELKSFGLLPSKNIFYSADFGIDDINLIYKYVDVLITDLSSSIFDYLIFGRPVVIFMPDYNEYLNGRGVYPVFNDLIIENSLNNWKDLIDSIKRGKWFDDKLIMDISLETAAQKDVCNNILNDLIERFDLHYLENL